MYTLVYYIDDRVSIVVVAVVVVAAVVTVVNVYYSYSYTYIYLITYHGNAATIYAWGFFSGKVSVIIPSYTHITHTARAVWSAKRCISREFHPAHRIVRSPTYIIITNTARACCFCSETNSCKAIITTHMIYYFGRLNVCPRIHAHKNTRSRP